MSFFNTTTKICHASPIPSSITREFAVKMLHNHAFFMTCDPHFQSYKTLPTPDPAPSIESYKLPPDVVPLDEKSIKIYEVTDDMPNPVWSSKIVCKNEFVDYEKGLWVRLYSPLNVVMETTWRIEGEEGKDGKDGLQLVEDVIIKSPRLLSSLLRNTVENNWQNIHKKMINKAKEDQEAASKA